MSGKTRRFCCRVIMAGTCGWCGDRGDKRAEGAGDDGVGRW